MGCHDTDLRHELSHTRLCPYAPRARGKGKGPRQSDDQLYQYTSGFAALQSVQSRMAGVCSCVTDELFQSPSCDRSTHSTGAIGQRRVPSSGAGTGRHTSLPAKPGDAQPQDQCGNIFCPECLKFGYCDSTCGRPDVVSHSALEEGMHGRSRAKSGAPRRPCAGAARCGQSRCAWAALSHRGGE